VLVTDTRPVVVYINSVITAISWLCVSQCYLSEFRVQTLRIQNYDFNSCVTSTLLYDCGCHVTAGRAWFIKKTFSQITRIIQAQASRATSHKKALSPSHKRSRRERCCVGGDAGEGVREGSGVVRGRRRVKGWKGFR